MALLIGLLLLVYFVPKLVSEDSAERFGFHRVVYEHRYSVSPGDTTLQFRFVPSVNSKRYRVALVLPDVDTLSSQEPTLDSLRLWLREGRIEVVDEYGSVVVESGSFSVHPGNPVRFIWASEIELVAGRDYSGRAYIPDTQKHIGLELILVVGVARGVFL